MLTEKDYCDLDTSHELWVMGLEPEAYYDGPLILLYEAQKFLREEKGIIVGIINNFTIQAFDWYVSTWEEDLCRGNKYVSYEEALAEGLREAVKLLKEKEDE